MEEDLVRLFKLLNNLTLQRKNEENVPILPSEQNEAFELFSFFRKFSESASTKQDEEAAPSSNPDAEAAALIRARKFPPAELTKVVGQWGTLIHYAAERGAVSTVEAALDCGVAVDHRDHRERTILHLAALHGSRPLVELLLARGAEVDARSDYYETPLCAAAAEGSLEIVELLLSHGADPNVRRAYYLDTAARGANEDVKKLLKKYLRRMPKLERTAATGVPAEGRPVKSGVAAFSDDRIKHGLGWLVLGIAWHDPFTVLRKFGEKLNLQPTLLDARVSAPPTEAPFFVLQDEWCVLLLSLEAAKDESRADVEQCAGEIASEMDCRTFVYAGYSGGRRYLRLFPRKIKDVSEQRRGFEQALLIASRTMKPEVYARLNETEPDFEALARKEAGEDRTIDTAIGSEKQALSEMKRVFKELRVFIPPVRQRCIDGTYQLEIQGAKSPPLDFVGMAFALQSLRAH